MRDVDRGPAEAAPGDGSGTVRDADRGPRGRAVADGRGQPVSGVAGNGVVAVTGDVVGSRRFLTPDRLLAGLDRVLAGVDAVEPATERLHRTGGDVFLGVYRDLGSAATAVLRLRLATDDLVLPTADGVDEPVELRLGLGIDDPVDDARGASGPTADAGPTLGDATVAAARAREALLEAEQLGASRTWPDSLRSRCRAGEPVLAAAVNAHLLLQDQLLARLDARDRRALLGLLDGERQVDVARSLGVTQPAIARRLRARGSLALHRAVLELRTATRAADSGVGGI